MDGSRTEFAQVVAQPDGRLQFESAVVPQRTRTASGWTDVDLGLVRGGDGLWRPAASVAEVAFSGGGAGPLVTLSNGGRTMEMTWSGGVLPAPVVSADSATYPNVLTDVDLVVRATRTGFSHVLVVKSANAAADPAVRQIRFGLGGDAQVRSDPAGRLRASAGATVVASAEPPVMWDSRTTQMSTRSALPQTSDVEFRSTAAAAGDAAQVAPVDVEVTDGELVLRPDTELLTAPDVVFPLYVDPAWSVDKTRWAYATNNGSSNSDTGRARVGRDEETGVLYRSFFEFPTTANNVSLKGKHIESGYVQMKLDHSWSCGNTVTTLYRTAVINATPKASWSTALRAHMASASGHANEAGGCSSIQPDMIMNFSGSGVLDALRMASDERWNTLTVGLTARASDGSGESTQDRWKKFFPNDAKLFADYDTKPGAPHSLAVARTVCPASGVLTVGSLTPTLAARFPDGDGTRDSLTGTFEWIEVPAAGMGAVTDTSPTRKTPPPAKTGLTPDAWTESNPLSIVAERTYAFRARGTDKAPYSLTGPWSAWCQFRADTTVPPVTATMLTVPAGPGMRGRVRFQSTATDVMKFKYGWGGASKEVTAQGTGPKYAEVDLIAPKFGRNVLLVRAVDATLNEGSGSVEFTVGRPTPPIAKWGLQTYPGVDQAAALADGQQVPTDSPLTATNVTWADGVRLVGGQTATFNGSSSVATTTASVVNTAGSFSVAAWVRPGVLPTGHSKAVAQEGVDAGGFDLGVRPGTGSTPYWAFVMKDTSAQSSTTRAAASTTAITASDVGRWTHLAGVYDATEKTIRLYVNGQLVSEADRTAAPWSASGRFVVGRGFGYGGAENWWNGSVADVQVFDRVLVPQDFTGQLAADPYSGGFNEPGILSPVQVGNWDFEAARSCYLTNLKQTCEAPDAVTSWDRWLALTRGSAVSSGHTLGGSGLWLDYEYFPEDGYTESSEEYGRSAVKTGATPPDGDGNEFTTWQETPVLRTDDSFTMSAWVMLDRLDGERTAVSQRGVHESTAWLKYSPSGGGWKFAVSSHDSTSTTTASVTSTSMPEIGAWTHLTGVYEAGRKEIRLYVNGELEGRQSLAFTPMVSSGPLLVGRTLWHDQLVDQWTGAIDNVAVFQGAMTDTAAFDWYNSQTPVDPGTNTMTRGKLTDGQYLRSDIGNYQLLMQPDGNLVLYQAGFPLWETGTSGNPGAYLQLQADGNLVVYSADDVALWSSGTADTPGDRLVIRDDGDLVLLDVNGQVLWRR
ncbi:LamG-like jellyroll fold domain-containing protein [Plantactinospora sp. B24E8]